MQIGRVCSACMGVRSLREAVRGWAFIPLIIKYPPSHAQKRTHTHARTHIQTRTYPPSPMNLCSYDYENVESDKADAMMKHLTSFVGKPAFRCMHGVGVCVVVGVCGCVWCVCGDLNLLSALPSFVSLIHTHALALAYNHIHTHNHIHTCIHTH